MYYVYYFMNICIGIISYLPNNNKRSLRFNKLINLLKSCDDLFNLPIIIVAQEWQDEEVDSVESNDLTIYRYSHRLGIVGARKALRKKFLESNYDYIILLDDDCELSGSKESAKLYVDQIKNNPDKCGLFYGTVLKLFAISKNLFFNVDFRDGSVENGDFFEDILFVNTIKKKFPNRVFVFKRGNLKQKSNNYNDENSTWYWGQYNKKEIGDRTREILGGL